MKEPKVSIGIPVYNASNYLSEALDSILGQTYTDLEIILSDNASTDSTQEICLEYLYRDSRIRYDQNPQNLGAAKNYNHCFELSSGQYFKWAAHDDLLEPEFVQKCVEMLERAPEIILCYPRTRLLDESNRVFGSYADNLLLDSSQPHTRLRKFFDNQGLCHAIFGLIRSDVLRRTALIGNFPMSDRVLLGELALLGKFAELPDYLFIRRIHPQISTVANVTEQQIATWFDPRLAKSPILPKWRRLFEYTSAIRRARLGVWESLRCYLQLTRFIGNPERWRGLMRDINNAGKSFAIYFQRKRRS